ncbi:Iron sulfur cluster assembly protein 1 like [Verticillium longisporum]|nr:Iron sulfur cluster assembly protein 1 like [Verticillium longisporum]
MLSRTLRAASRSVLSTPIRPTTIAPRQLAPAVSVNATRAYHEKVLDHYSRPRNVGTLKGDDVGSGLVGAPACGDVMKINIRVDPNTNTISDVKFKTFGCGSAIASSSYLTELPYMYLGRAKLFYSRLSALHCVTKTLVELVTVGDTPVATDPRLSASTESHPTA